MNAKRIAALLVLALLMTAAGSAAQGQQEKSPPPPPPPREDVVTMSVMPLKITVVFSEYDGEKKISSLPYVLNHNATRGNSRTSLRMGLRVPIVANSAATAAGVAPPQVQYHNVGTDIDCLVTNREGLYQLHLELRRSSVYSPEVVPGRTAGAANENTVDMYAARLNPVIREFSGAVDALLRDGQTVQTTMATDPVSGRVLRVDVTLNVIK
jgi:hypothetical protein